MQRKECQIWQLLVTPCCSLLVNMQCSEIFSKEPSLTQPDLTQLPSSQMITSLASPLPLLPVCFLASNIISKLKYMDTTQSSISGSTHTAKF